MAQDHGSFLRDPFRGCSSLRRHHQSIHRRWHHGDLRRTDRAAPAQAVKRLIVLCSLMLAFAVQSFANTAPSLPQATVDVTMPTQTGSTIVVNSGGDFQAALNAANPGDIIQLAAGGVFAGNFVVPTKANDATHWIIIRTSAYASLPAAGTRISPANVGSMAKIRTTNSDAALKFAGAKYYRLQGIEIDTNWTSQSSTQYDLVCMGADSSCNNATQSSALPHHIVFDRVYAHGTATGDIRRGISAQGNYIAVIDSYISDIHALGVDSQAFVS